MSSPASTLAGVYAGLRRRADASLERGRLEAAILIADLAASIAYQLPFGLWQDDDLERRLETIVPRLRVEGGGRPSRKGAVVHLVPKLAAGGGMRAALIANLEALWGDREQVVVSTGSGSERVEPRFVDDLERAGARVVGGPALRELERAEWIARTLRSLEPGLILGYVTASAADFVGLAWARRVLGVPVVRFNYGDVFPLLGKSVADVWVEMREAGVELSRRFRGIDSAVALPLPVPRRTSPDVPRSELGVPEGATLSLTISPYWKLMGDGSTGFIAAVLRLLELEPAHWHLLICPNLPAWAGEAIGRHPAGARFLTMGFRRDPDALLRACDFLVEGFPVIGGMVRAEAVASAVPLLAWCDPRHDFLGRGLGELPRDYPWSATGPGEWLRLARGLASSAEQRAAARAWLGARGREAEAGHYRRRLLAILAAAESGARLPPEESAAAGREGLEIDLDFFCRLFLGSRPDIGRSEIARAQQSGVGLSPAERWAVFRHLLRLSWLCRTLSPAAGRELSPAKVLYFWSLNFLWVLTGSDRAHKKLGERVLGGWKRLRLRMRGANG